MIQNDSVKSSIQSYYAKDQDLDESQKTAIETIAYEHVMSVLKESTASNDATTIIGSYGAQLKSKFLALKGKYVSYSKILEFISGIGAGSVLELTEEQIRTIYSYYCDDTQIEEFSDSHFSENMYGVSGLSDRECRYLKSIHENVMCPIIEYYAKFYGASIGSMEIVSCDSVKGNAGKVIVFYIGNIDSGRVYSDIKTGKIGVRFVRINNIFPYVMITNS
jgi:hypothetical protein